MPLGLETTNNINLEARGTQSPVSQTPQYDPQIVSLAKSIGMTESGGNYNSKMGADKEQGAYQMTPGFVANYAPKYLKDYQPGVPLNNVQQDELAYGIIKDWRTTGKPGYEHLGKLSPAQVASAWNAGDPDAYLSTHQGTSAGGAHYDTNSYVDKVKTNYEKLNPESSGTKATNYTSPTNLALAGGAALGIGAIAAPELAGGGLLAGLGSEIGNIAGGIKNYITGIPKALVGGAVSDAVKSAMPQQQNIANLSQNQALSTEQNPTENYSAQLLKSQIPQESASSKLVSDLIMQTLSNTKGGRVLSQDPNMQEAVRTMGKYGFAPEVVDGAMDFTSADEKKKQTINKLSEGVGEALKDEISPLEQVRAEAKKGISNHPLLSPKEQEEANNHIDKELESYAKKYSDKNGNISHQNLERMKSQMWRGYKNILDTSSVKAAKKALGFGARATITQNTKHKEFYNAAMKEEQRMYNAGKVMKRLNGTKAKEHKSIAKSLLHGGGRYVALYIGDKIGGPMGAVLGDMVGQHIIGAIDKRHGKTIFETPAVHRAIDQIQKDHPEYYKLLVSELKKHGIKADIEKKKKQEGLLKLPAPAIRLPEQKRETKMTVLEANKTSIKNPKSGRFERGYTSEGKEMKKPPVSGVKNKAIKKAIRGNTRRNRRLR